MSDLARVHARELLRALSIEGPFDVLEVATRLGLEIVESEVSGFDGALVRVVGVPLGTIIVKRSIRESGRKNFTIAHEVGHFVLPHHATQGATCRSEDVENWAKSLPREECEANVFAGEFLIPEPYIRERACRATPSFESIRWMAETFSTSLTASAYRLMNLTTFRAAIVWSTAGQIRWFKPSAEFQVFVPVREKVLEGTVAYKCLQRERVPDRFERVPAELWVQKWNMRPDATVLEHSILLPYYQSVLTLLHVDEPLELPEREEEALGELDPEEFTLRRKRWPR
jgi:IrrE N-terminal-like domain